MRLLVFCITFMVWKSAQGESEKFQIDGFDNDNIFMSNENGRKAETFGTDNIAHSFGKDSLEIVGLSSYATPTFQPKINYSTAGPRILVVDVFAVGADRMKVVYHTEWTDSSNYHETKLKVLKVNLPDSLVFREDKAINIHTDLHSDYLLVRASMLDFDNPSALLRHTEESMKLTPPWRRPEKKGYSCSWKGMVLKKFTENRIPKCSKVNNAVDLLLFPAVLIKSEHGYKKFFERLRLTQEDLLQEDQNGSPQFTLATWLYLIEGCPNDMCPLIHHIKSSAYLTPLIGLLKSGYLHVQVHYKDGSGYAFLVDAQIPVHKWVHVAITVKGTVTTLFIRHGKYLQHSKLFVHSDFPSGVFHYNDTDGHWTLGGSPGYASAKGFIGPARIYRGQILPIEIIKKVFTPRSKPNLGLSNYFKQCRRLTSKVQAMLKKQNAERSLCLARQFLRNVFVRHLDCRVGLEGLAAEIVNISYIWQNETHQGDEVQQNIYNYAFRMIKAGRNNVKDALNLLFYSSCLGHSPSLYLTSVIYQTGLGTNVDSCASQRSLLVGALHNHPLSQMSIAYKHFIGVDGFPEDTDVAQTYYRHAADLSSQFLSQHNEVDTHAEAVRLDKKEDLDNYRGPNSNWFSWLKHQAIQGVTDAQSVMGEVFYYGARGFRRNLTKAAQFYEMGASRGNAQMLFNLGVVKLRGQGVSINEEEARDLLKKSADLGFAPAFNALGYYELNVRKNKTGALHYFELAAKHDDRDGLFNLGYAHENALAPGSTPDLKLAMPYYINAARKGHPGACIVAGDAFSKGNHVDRNTHLAIIYFKFVADQIPELGMHLRKGLDEYFESSWYSSLLYYLLAAEAGMEVAQYNVALLCDWDWGGVSKHTTMDCMWRYYNHSAKLQWTPSLIKTGDNHWYGITVKKNITAAAQLYSKAASKEENPQAIYNLGYLVENNYSLDGLMWMDFYPYSLNPGNLSFAARLYRKCRDLSNEALIPCSLGLLRVAIKMAWEFQLVNNQVLPLLAAVFVVLFVGLVIYICRFNGENQTLDLA